MECKCFFILFTKLNKWFGHPDVGQLYKWLETSLKSNIKYIFNSTISVGHLVSFNYVKRHSSICKVNVKYMHSLVALLV